MATPIRFKLHPAQKEILRGHTKRTVLRCGRKFGKTKITRRFLVGGILNQEWQAYVAPEYSYLLEWWEKFMYTYGKHGEGLVEYNNRQDKTMRMYNGAKIDLGSLDDAADNLRPREYNRVLIDEVSYSPNSEEAWEKSLAPTLAARDGSVLLMSTPATKKGGPFFKRICKSKYWKEFHFTTYDNPHIPRSWIEEQRLTLPTDVFRQEILAEFVDFAGARIKQEWIEDRVPHKEPQAGWTYSLGVDPAISVKKDSNNDYTALVVTGKNKDGDMVVCQDKRGHWTLNDMVAKINEMAGYWKVENITPESVQAQEWLAQELRMKTPHVINSVNPSGMGDKLARFMRYCEGKIEHGHMKLSENISDEFVEELLRFPYCAHDEHDDLVDALVYSSVGLFSGTQVYDI